jgi:U3 small nucleolar RNA-associated protein 14
MSGKKAGGQDDPKYVNMLKQMGLTPDAVPADMKDAIMSKLGISGVSSKHGKSSEDGQ